MPDLLLELLSEEIPARMQARAAEDLKKRVTDGLVEAGLTYEGAAAHAGPRRLTLDLRGLDAETKPRREERKGPRVGAPEKALEGFLRGAGVARDALKIQPDKKGDVYIAIIETPGRRAGEIVAEVVAETIRSFPWPKSMRWGAGDLRWVRPLRSILCVLADESGAQVVPVAVEGVPVGAETRGHRNSGAGAIRAERFDEYVSKLAAAQVVVSAEERRERIRHDAANLAFARGFELVEDEGLLAEVAGLAEWPAALLGDIPEDFLSLPPEVLRTSMKEHQKFFSVRNPATGRIEAFITVANIEARDGGAAILAGNIRVLSARLADARFFWENDRRVSLEAMAEPLARVTFHSELGSQADRVARIAALARGLAPAFGAEPEAAARAATLSKADLASQMVYEFPELQGIMGRYYALEAGEPEAVADAIRDHYAPLGPGDAAPLAPVSASVAMADKLDMLAGFWAIDEKPTGSRDPFALRRAALGVIRILLETGARLKLRAALAPAFAAHGGGDADDLLRFFADRLKVFLRERGVRHDVIDAVFALEGRDDLVALVARAEAVQALIDSEDGRNLLAGWKRAANILAAEEKKDGVEYGLDPEPSLAEAGAEQALFAALDAAEPALGAALKAEEWATGAQALAALRGPIDAFFDGVTVNSESAAVRRNRLCLLNRVRRAGERMAMLGMLEG